MDYSLIFAGVALAALSLVSANRAGRAESALRRIVETQTAVMAANETAPQAEYERFANERDDAIDAAAEVLR
jgi:hypothetical protein